MMLVILVDLLALVLLLRSGVRKGVENALPIATFFLILLPEESKLPILGLFDITSQRFVTLVLLAMVMVQRKPSGRGYLRAPLKGFVVAIAVWWAISASASIASTESLKALLALLLDYLTIYWIVATNISSVQTVRRLLVGSVAGLVLSSIFGIVEAYGNWSVVSLFPTEIHRFGASGGLYLDDARGIRIQSTFGHPILFGSALAIGIPMTLYLLSSSKKTFEKVWLWSGVLLMFVCIFKTSSRGPWLALGLSLFIFLLFGCAQIKKYVVVIGLIAVAAVVIRPGVGQTLLDDYLSTVDDHSSQGQSYQYRYALYELVMEKLASEPPRMIWGYGEQSFPYLHLSGTIDGRGMEFVSCDSSIAALLVETGYVGLLLMGSFLGYVLFVAAASYKRQASPYDQVPLLFFVNLLAFYFEMTNVAILGWGQQTIMLWVTIALTLIYPELVRQQKLIKQTQPAFNMQAETAGLAIEAAVHA